MSISTDHLSEGDLALQLEQAGKVIEVGGLYAHYRDPKSPYKVIALAIIEATQEVGVAYRKEFGSDVMRSITWIRPLTSWLEKVDFEGRIVPRFQKV